MRLDWFSSTVKVPYNQFPESYCRQLPFFPDATILFSVVQKEKLYKCPENRVFNPVFTASRRKTMGFVVPKIRYKLPCVTFLFSCLYVTRRVTQLWQMGSLRCGSGLTGRAQLPVHSLIHSWIHTEECCCGCVAMGCDARFPTHTRKLSHD